MTKALSMRNLYNLASEYEKERTDEWAEEDIANLVRRKEDTKVIDLFLNYVWEHRNDKN